MLIQHTTKSFDCGTGSCVYAVTVFRDEQVRNYKFHFTIQSHCQTRFPAWAKSFAVIMSFNRQVLFNRMTAGRNPVKTKLRELINDYVKGFRFEV